MPTPTSYPSALQIAEESAHVAAAILRAERARPGGPRGSKGHCPADVEAQRLIRERLLAAFPGWGYRGEETPFKPPASGSVRFGSIQSAHWGSIHFG